MIPKLELTPAFVTVMILAMLRPGSTLGADATTPSPEGFYKEAVKDAGRQVKDGGAGEDFCWVAAYYMGDFVKPTKRGRIPRGWMPALSSTTTPWA